jgi:hypothetical protein
MVFFKNKSALFSLWAASAHIASSLTVTQADFAALAARLIAPNSGLTLIDGSYTGSPLAAGTFDAPGPQGLAAGIILSTGRVVDATLQKSQFSSTGFALPGSDLCNAIAPGVSSRDAALLTMNLAIDKTKFNGLSMSFIFGSEEFPNYVGDSFNDVLGIYVNGQNVALDSAGKAVAINNGFFASDKVVTNDDSVYGGSTPILSVNAPIAADASTVKLEIVVCDSGDTAYDSAVFVTLLKGVACSGPCDGVAVIATSAPSPVATGVNPKCNRDNCLRGLFYKNNNFLTAAVADCQTALPTVTVIPGSVTQTITGPAALPTNANVCDGQGSDKRLARYISACSCASVSPVTTTAAATMTITS